MISTANADCRHAIQQLFAYYTTLISATRHKDVCTQHQLFLQALLILPCWSLHPKKHASYFDALNAQYCCRCSQSTVRLFPRLVTRGSGDSTGWPHTSQVSDLSCREPAEAVLHWQENTPACGTLCHILGQYQEVCAPWTKTARKLNPHFLKLNPNTSFKEHVAARCSYMYQKTYTCVL
jgi:hypothetical protein